MNGVPLKYRLEPDEATGLQRVVALRDIPEIGVRAGDLGGLIESEDNLSQAGAAWESGNARVYGMAEVSGTTRVSSSARVVAS